MNDANHRVAETATVSQSIAADIASVNSIAAERERDSTQIEDNAVGLSQLSNQLQEQVQRFRI